MNKMQLAILAFLTEHPDYVLVHGYGGVYMKLKELPKPNRLPLGRRESEQLTLIGQLEGFDAYKLGNELFELERKGKLVCERPEERGCTLEERYSLPVSHPLLVAA